MMGRIMEDEGAFSDDGGFTLIEMLVVIVIVSILAAIAIPIFVNQREKGWEAQMVAALTNSSIAMEAAFIGQGQSYDGITVVELIEEEDLRFAASVTAITIESANTQGYCLSATHLQWGETLYWDSEDAEASPTDCSGNY